MTNTLCPQCERPLVEHDAAHCKRRMSRRFFFQAVGGGIIAATFAKVLPVVMLTPAKAAENLHWVPGTRPCSLLQIKEMGLYHDAQIAPKHPWQVPNEIPILRAEHYFNPLTVDHKTHQDIFNESQTRRFKDETEHPKRPVISPFESLT